jgi:DNA-binding beta-propeller fold protein YncE
LIHEEGKSGVAGVMVFNTESFLIKDIIPLTDDETRRRSMQGSYIDISPDGRYVYATVFNWQGGGGYGSFHVIDLEKGEQVFESVCGGFAWIGVSPDGRYVYLSDSAGTPFFAGGISLEFNPTNQILRYDVNRRRIDVFVDGGRDLGLSGTDILITSSIAVAPDSRSMYIRVLFGGRQRKDFLRIFSMSIQKRKNI